MVKWVRGKASHQIALQPHRPKNIAVSHPQKPSSSSVPPQPFRFLCLPVELRLKVYSCAFYCPRVGDFTYTTIVPPGIKEPKSCLSLLLACRQIYAEAHAYFYRLNTFYFFCTDTLYYFLRSIGPIRRMHVRALRFEYHSTQAHPIGFDCCKSAFRLLKTCGRLEWVSFNLWIDRQNGYDSLREVRGLKTVLIKQRAPLSLSQRIHAWVNRVKLCRSGMRIEGPAHLSTDSKELERAMKRPRLKRYMPDEEEEVDLFKRWKPRKRRTEVQMLMSVRR